MNLSCQICIYMCLENISSVRPRTILLILSISYFAFFACNIVVDSICFLFICSKRSVICCNLLMVVFSSSAILTSMSSRRLLTASARLEYFVFISRVRSLNSVSPIVTNHLSVLVAGPGNSGTLLVI